MIVCLRPLLSTCVLLLSDTRRTAICYQLLWSNLPLFSILEMCTKSQPLLHRVFHTLLLLLAGPRMSWSCSFCCVITSTGYHEARALILCVLLGLECSCMTNKRICAGSIQMGPRPSGNVFLVRQSAMCQEASLIHPLGMIVINQTCEIHVCEHASMSITYSIMNHNL